MKNLLKPSAATGLTISVISQVEAVMDVISDCLISLYATRQGRSNIGEDVVVSGCTKPELFPCTLSIKVTDQLATRQTSNASVYSLNTCLDAICDVYFPK